MACVRIYRWAPRDPGSILPWRRRHGHLGMVVETRGGAKTYITMLGDAVAPSLPQELRLMTGIRGALEPNGIANHRMMLEHLRMQPRPGQEVVTAPHVGHDVDIHARYAPVGRRVTIRQAGSVGPGGGADRMSLVLAAGQIYQPPTEIFTLPALTDTQLGIDTEKIFHWWKSYAGRVARQRTKGWQTKKLENQYRMMSTHLNCAGTVYLALRVGGATYFKGRAFTRLYSTPEGVLSWAKNVAENIEELNRAAAANNARSRSQRAEFERKVGRNMQADPNDLPTLAEWQRISYVGVMARRKEQIAVMDQQLAIYHRYHWNDPQAIAEKARALDNIMRAAEEHARLKPKSDRSHAVSYLIAKAWEVLEERLKENDDDQEFYDQRIEELDNYKSLAFTDAEFKELFMGDEWIVERDLIEYKDVAPFTDNHPYFEEQLQGDRLVHRPRPDDSEDDD